MRVSDEVGERVIAVERARSVASLAYQHLTIRQLWFLKKNAAALLIPKGTVKQRGRGSFIEVLVLAARWRLVSLSAADAERVTKLFPYPLFLAPLFLV
jgi:hypothetical protein